MHKRWATLLIVVLLGGILLGCSPSPTVAMVDEEKITRAELDQRVNLMLDQFERMYGMTFDPVEDKDMLEEVRTQSVDSLVQEKILLMEADRRNIKADTKEVDSNLKNVKSSMGGEEEYKAFLKKTKLKEKDIKQILTNQSILDQLQEQVTKDVKVSDAETQEYFNKNSSQYDTPREVRISHILVETEKEATDIIAELKKGTDFATVAKDKSKDGSAAQGGDLGWANASTNFVPEFLNAAMALKPGQMTEKPVKSEFGYHIIKCFDEHAEQKAEFAKVATTVQKDALENKKAETFSKFQEDLKKKADVKTFPENYTEGAADKDTNDKDTNDKDTDSGDNGDNTDSKDKK